MKSQTLPEWYNRREEASTAPPRAKRKAGISVRKALGSLGAAIARDVSNAVCEKSWLGRIDPRAKIIGMFALIFGVTFLHSLTSLAVMLAITLIMAASIRLPAKQLARAWLAVPMFSLAIILPATTNLVTQGDTLLTIVSFGKSVRLGPLVLPEAITVTDNGLIVAGRFLLRSTTCITLAYLLVVTTQPAVLLNGLRRLGMPKIFGMVLTMSHRYLVTILRVAEEIHIAKLSRTITSGHVRTEQRWAASGIGILFRRTHKLAVEVQNAMIARGYNGDLRITSHPTLCRSDLIWVAASFAIISVIILADRVMKGIL